MILGTIFGVVSALMFAFANISIKPSTDLFGAWGAVIWAQLMGIFVVTLLAVFFAEVPSGIGWSEVGWTVAGGLSAILAYGGLFSSFKQGAVSLLSPIVSMWMLVSVFIGVVFLHESVGYIPAVGIFLVLLGNVAANYIHGKSDHGTHTPTKSILWAICSALGFGLLMPIVAVLGRSVGVFWAMPLVWGTELILLLPFGLFPRLPVNAKEWWVAGRVALYESTGFLAITYGSLVAPVSLIAPISSLSVVFTIALGLFLLNEKLSAKVLMAIAVVCVGIVLVNL